MAGQKRSPRKPKGSTTEVRSKASPRRTGLDVVIAENRENTKDAEAQDATNTMNETKLTPPTTKPAVGEEQAELPAVGSAQLVRNGENKQDAQKGNKRTMTISDIETVQNLIEKCLQLYLTKDEVISVLREQATIDAEFTKLIWGRLEGENPQFFRCYNTRLKLKAQITMFNHLLEQQISVVKRMKDGWSTYPNTSATASGIPLFQSGGQFGGFDDGDMKIEMGQEGMGIRKTWSLSDFMDGAA